MQVFLVHGEYAAEQILAGLVRDRFGYEVWIPDYLEESILKAGEARKRLAYPDQAAPRIDWDDLLGEMDVRLAQIRERSTGLRDRTWVEQTEIRDRLLEIKRHLTELMTQM
jgi:metallo-beta-lactamase family protein